MNKEELEPFPPAACDTHVHIYDGRYPVDERSVLRPPDASIAQYRAFQTRLGLERCVLVQPTTYGLDNSCQLDAMATLGSTARGVMVVDETVSDTTLDHMTRLGVRGARFHMLPGGVLSWDTLAPVARRIHPFGWHVQLQTNGRELHGRVDELLALPGSLVVDHIGRFMPPVPVDHPSFSALLRLIDTGRCWVKVSAPYESSAVGEPGYEDVAELADALVRYAPERLLWASNWPHPGQHAPPTAPMLHSLLNRWARDPYTRQRMLVDNPAELYDF